MAEQQYYPATDGQEFGIPDAQGVGVTSGLADDRTLDELLRMTPFDGTNTYKTILPYGVTPIDGSLGSTPANPGTVQPSGSANGSILVNPFRAIVGSRVAAASDALENWRDIRSSVVTGSSGLTQTFQLAANSSGNPRWDLVYVTLSVDVASGTQLRRVKNPSTGVVSAIDVTTVLLNPAVVSVLTGTPAATPAIPSLPADSGGNYNIAIAAVLVPNGFSATSTVLTTQIRDQVGNLNLTNGAGQTVAALHEAVTQHVKPASGNNDRAGTYATNRPYTTTRPGMFLPPGMAGGGQMFVEVYNVVSTPSHPNNSIVDNSIDWRNRMVVVFVQTTTSITFANDPTGTPGNVMPLYSAQPAVVSSHVPFLQMSQTFQPDATLATNGSTVIVLGTSATVDGTTVGLYVLSTDGTLRWSSSGASPNASYAFWIWYSGQFPNF